MFLNIFFQHIFAQIHTFLRYIDKRQAEESAVKQVKIGITRAAGKRAIKRNNSTGTFNYACRHAHKN